MMVGVLSLIASCHAFAWGLNDGFTVTDVNTSHLVALQMSNSKLIEQDLPPPNPGHICMMEGAIGGPGGMTWNNNLGGKSQPEYCRDSCIAQGKDTFALACPHEQGFFFCRCDTYADYVDFASRPIDGTDRRNPEECGGVCMANQQPVCNSPSTDGSRTDTNCKGWNTGGSYISEYGGYKLGASWRVSMYLIEAPPSPPPSPPPPAPSPPPPPPPSLPPLTACIIYGDPHVRKFHQTATSLIAQGQEVVSKKHVWLVKSDDVFIQARYEILNFDDAASFSKSSQFMTAVAIGGPFLEGRTLVLRPQNSKNYWKGKEILQALDSEYEDDLIKAKYTDEIPHVHRSKKNVPGIIVDLPMGVHLLANRFRQHIGVEITLPPSSFTGKKIGGQCGNANGDASEDTETMISNGQDWANDVAEPDNMMSDYIF